MVFMAFLVILFLVFFGGSSEGNEQPITGASHAATADRPVRILVEHPYGNDYARLKVVSAQDYVRCDIAGMRYREGIENCVGEFVGDLVAEPENPHDQEAVKVIHSNGTHLGYIPRNYDGDEIRRNVTLPHECYGMVQQGENGYYGIVVVTV